MKPVDTAPTFLLMVCECGRTRAEHMAPGAHEDHHFEPVDKWARREGQTRGTKGRI